MDNEKRCELTDEEIKYYNDRYENLKNSMYSFLKSDNAFDDEFAQNFLYYHQAEFNDLTFLATCSPEKRAQILKEREEQIKQTRKNMEHNEKIAVQNIFNRYESEIRKVHSEALKKDSYSFKLILPYVYLTEHQKEVFENILRTNLNDISEMKIILNVYEIRLFDHLFMGEPYFTNSGLYNTEIYIH